MSCLAGVRRVVDACGRLLSLKEAYESPEATSDLASQLLNNFTSASMTRSTHAHNETIVL